MAKFNTRSTGTKTENLAGGIAYKTNPKFELVSILLTSFVQDKFYKTAQKEMSDLETLIKQDPLFAAKASIYARNEFGMRSITHVAAATIAKEVKGQEWTKRYFKQVFRRVDDMTETMALYLSKHGKPIPNSLKKGARNALDKFDEYQLGKYRSARSGFKLVDLVNLVHPKHTDAIAKLVKDELRQTNTWENELTKAGQSGKTKEEKDKLKKEAWEKLIRERKIGYFALLRNLRNIIEQSPDVLDEALELLVDEKLIRKSLVLPFRYMTAYEELQKVPRSRKAIMALSKACDIALANVPELPGRTLIALDSSGSMGGGWGGSRDERRTPLEVGSQFAAVLYKRCNADLVIFDTDIGQVNVNPADSIIGMTDGIRNAANQMGGGTDFHLIFQNSKDVYDRVIILSDMQGWHNSGYYNGGTSVTNSYHDYKKRTGADPHVYSFDLQGYGTLQLPEKQVYCLAGFSDKIFDVMKLLEQDRNALINKIESVTI